MTSPPPAQTPPTAERDPRGPQQTRDVLPPRTFSGEPLPEAWMEEITAPGEDDEDEQHAYTRLLTAIGDYRRRHHRAGPDVLGPRPRGLDGDDFDHLTDAIDFYTHARVRRCLEQMRRRTTADRALLLPPTSPLSRPLPQEHRPGQLPPTR
ncbi:hypothetical protein ABZ478_19465 [Streptomyces sp. NPDC005706]|uniref:hypothetical protein n=1 Tax=Streptomyces sp. NPDC005706 TaxID=3157169 RepID=UPI0033C46CB9